MTRRAPFAGGFLCCLILVTPAGADAGLVFSVGESQTTDTTWRIGVQGDFNRTLWTSDSGSVRLTPHWDAAVTRLTSIDTNAVSISPMLRLVWPGRQHSFYLEGGIGIAWFSRRVLERHFEPGEGEIGSRDLGSRWNLEDRLGAGVEFPGGSELGVRVIHYSNADFALPNDGINVYLAHWYIPF